MKIAFLHQLPIEYYPPASNLLDLLGKQETLKIRAYTTKNRKQRKNYSNTFVTVFRNNAPDPASVTLVRLWVAFWWHLKTAFSLARFRPEVVMYCEPHSALAAWIFFVILRGKSRLFIHHHEYYEKKDYYRPGMRIPGIGHKCERSDLFRRAEWISQTNVDRLRLIMKDCPQVRPDVWRLLPNYPPTNWCTRTKSKNLAGYGRPLRLVYTGSASFNDTYIREIAEWASKHPAAVSLFICGYNVTRDVWDWLEARDSKNITFDATGYEYDNLPKRLEKFDIGLVLYKGNTKNFVYNVPNKVFEYLCCGLEVWYPTEMEGIRNFCDSEKLTLREIDFHQLQQWEPDTLQPLNPKTFEPARFTAEAALQPLFSQLGFAEEQLPT